MQQFALTLDLKDDKNLIAEYEAYHQQVWPEIIDSIKNTGIISLKIYRWHCRLFMLLIADEDFSFETKNKADANNAMVQKWETLMWQYQQALPATQPGSKWQLMDEIFSL
ncbi:MAG: L-rhamnose mutarotase [Bacteroidia bacterium]|nr:L-rhamnose mutarotase [Bacteroidia bacterium]HQU99789.1 L-rhamnose mutarotase [Bacteroidia bacterium]